MKCKICNKVEYKSYVSLAQHITRKHKWNTKDYYDEFLKSNEYEGKCLICEKNTKFMNINEGYRETCGNSHSAILKRKRLKENEEKYNKFINKVSKNQKKIWNNREKSGDKNIIIEKFVNSNKHNICKLSELERKEKFSSWFYNLSESERKIHIEKILKPLKDWYKNASEKDIEQKYDLMRKTMLGHRYYEDVMLEFISYRNKVRYLTEKTYKKYKNQINPNNLKRDKNTYQLDHKFSIVVGFENNIKPEIISSIYNLEILKAKDNNKKNYQCSITKKELLKLYYERSSKI